MCEFFTKLINMKTYLFTIIALFIVIGGAQAQHANLGIKGGLNFHTLQSNNSISYNPKVGLHIGLLCHIHLSDQFAIQPEIVFSGQGSMYKNNAGDVNFNLNYVNLPLLFQYMFDNGFRLQAGPQLGVLASAHYNRTDAKGDLSNTDLGLVVGMSYLKPLTGLGFDIRYNHGMTNINDINGANSYNRGLQVGLFYLFGTGHSNH